MDINYALAVMQIYPDIKPGIDFRNVFDVDGSQYITDWNYSQPQPTEDQLQAAWLEVLKNEKSAQIREAYNQTLVSGFNVTIGSTPYTFGWQSDDITHMNATQTAVSKGFLPLPIQYADVNGNPVTIPDQATLDLIEETATKFMMAQHQQGLKLVGEVQLATTPDEVNTFQWIPASY